MFASFAPSFLAIVLDLTRLALVFQHFGNEKYEVAQYDNTLQSYEASSVKIATSLAYLNSGQNIIFSSALTLMMALAAQGIMKGAFRPRLPLITPPLPE